MLLQRPRFRVHSGSFVAPLSLTLCLVTPLVSLPSKGKNIPPKKCIMKKILCHPPCKEPKISKRKTGACVYSKSLITLTLLKAHTVTMCSRSHLLSCPVFKMADAWRLPRLKISTVVASLPKIKCCIATIISNDTQPYCDFYEHSYTVLTVYI